MTGNTRRGWNDPPVLLHDTNLLSQQKKTAQNNRGPLENSAGQYYCIELSI